MNQYAINILSVKKFRQTRNFWRYCSYIMKPSCNGVKKMTSGQFERKCASFIKTISFRECRIFCLF